MDPDKCPCPWAAVTEHVIDGIKHCICYDCGREWVE